MKTAQIEFNTVPYEISHSHSPKGRGGWLFCEEHDYRANRLDKMVNFNGTFSEARKAAKLHFQNLAATVNPDCDYVCVVVCP